MVKCMSGAVDACVDVCTYTCNTHIHIHTEKEREDRRDAGEGSDYCKLLITVESNSRMHGCLLISFPIFCMLEIFQIKHLEKKISIC